MVVFLKVLYWDSTISYLHLCEKTNTPFWNSADEQNLKILTFKQSHVYSTSGFFYTIFTDMVVFRNNLKKYCFQLIWFFNFIATSNLSFMILNVKWIIGQRYPGEMRNTWWCSSSFCTGTSTISYLHLCEKTNTPIWNSADEQNLKLLTFKQSHIYSTSGFFYTTKFSQIWCVVFRNNLKKNVFNYYWFFTILLV